MFSHRNWFYKGWNHSLLKDRLESYGYKIVKARKGTVGYRRYRLRNTNGTIVFGKKQAVTLKDIAKWTDDKMIENNEFLGISQNQKDWPIKYEKFVRLSAAYKFGKAQGLQFNHCDRDYYISNFGRVFSTKTNDYTTPDIVGQKEDKPNSGYYRHNPSYKNKTSHFLAGHTTGFFFSPNAKNKPISHHVDVNSRNDYYINILWVTKKEHDELHALWKAGKKKEYYQRVLDIYKDNCGKYGGRWID